MNDHNAPRLTPWVARLLLLNAIVLLLQMTIFTGSWFEDLFSFVPAQVVIHPWTLVTYALLHASLLHLVTNSLALFVFGPPVERRLGAAGFVGYYLACAIGSSALCYLLWLVWPNLIAPFIGASGAILGVAFGFAKFLPDAEMMVFPFPIPVKAKHLVMIFAAIDVFGAVAGGGSIAHFAHLGGMASGWLIFRVRNLGDDIELPRIQTVRLQRPVAVRSIQTPRQSTMASGEAPSPPAKPVDKAAVEKAEMNRVLDKISASGLDSLTLDERRFLDQVAQRPRGGMN